VVPAYSEMFSTTVTVWPPGLMVSCSLSVIGQFAAVEALHQAQLDDVPLTGIEPLDRIPDELAQFGPFDAAGDVRRFGGAGVAARGGGQVGHLVERRGGFPRTQPAMAFVPRDRVQPGPELARVAEAAELGGGDEERILHRVGGIRGFAQQGPAVGVQRHRVPVVGFGDPVRIARHDGRDHLPVPHGHTVVRLPPMRQRKPDNRLNRPGQPGPAGPASRELRQHRSWLSPPHQVPR